MLAFCQLAGCIFMSFGSFKSQTFGSHRSGSGSGSGSGGGPAARPRWKGDAEFGGASYGGATAAASEGGSGTAYGSAGDGDASAATHLLGDSHARSVAGASVGARRLLPAARRGRTASGARSRSVGDAVDAREGIAGFVFQAF